MAKYYKNLEDKQRAFYSCIIGLWNRHKAGKEVNPSVMIDSYHLGHIKVEPYKRLATQKEKPTYDECVSVLNELRAYQSEMNRKSIEKKKKQAEQKDLDLFNDGVDINLDSFSNGVDIAAKYLLSKGWKVMKPEIKYVDYNY